MKLRGTKIFGTMAAWLALASALYASETFQLKNDKVQLEIDGRGNLVSLKNLVTQREYAGGQGLWRIIYQDGLSLEESLNAEEVPVEVKKTAPDEIQLSYGGDFPVSVACRLIGDEIIFTSEIKNDSAGKILREFQFPMIKNVQLASNSEFYWTYSAGVRYHPIPGWLKSGGTAYRGQDDKVLEKSSLYPGSLSMNYYVINEPDNALYIACNDPKFEKNLHLLRIRKIGDEYRDIDLAMVKYPFLKPGQSKIFAPYTVSPHAGDWHVSAKKYRRWAESSWYRHVPIQKSFLDDNGFQRVILRHQYGELLYRYDQLPEIYRAGKEAGLHTILLFAWWKEGHDYGYPEYHEDDTQGGDEALKKYIKQVQDEGGKICLYFNGQLIDVSTDFYKEKGKHLSVKLADGSEHFERYPFGGAGTALRVFGNRTFVTGCPATKEWPEILKTFVDRAIALGADGIFFDQLGWASKMCWDPTHGHDVPCTDIMHYKSEMVKEIEEYIRLKKPDMSFGTEWTSDPTLAHVDYTHNSYVNTKIVKKDRNGVPVTRYAPMTFYTFPEIRTTDREIYDDTDVERRVNLAILRGWRSDVCVYRCRAMINEAPKYKAYLTKANVLRDKYRDTILNGTFCDTDHAVSDSKQIFYSTFTAGDKLALVVNQAHLDSTKATLTITGYSYVESDGLGGFTVEGNGDKATVELKKNGLAVLIFKKK